MNSPDYWERRKKLEELEEALARAHRNISWLREVMAELERLGEADSAAVVGASIENFEQLNRIYRARRDLVLEELAIIK
jgi:hypothetical protein